MANPTALRVRFEDLRTLAFGSISGTYALVGSTFSNPIRLINIVNDTDAAILVSFNGVDDKIYVPGSVAVVYDYSANKSDIAGYMEQAVGEGVYIKQYSDAPTSGVVAVTAVYASRSQEYGMSQIIFFGNVGGGATVQTLTGNTGGAVPPIVTGKQL